MDSCRLQLSHQLLVNLFPLPLESLHLFQNQLHLLFSRQSGFIVLDGFLPAFLLHERPHTHHKELIQVRLVNGDKG